VVENNRLTCRHILYFFGLRDDSMSLACLCLLLVSSHSVRVVSLVYACVSSFIARLFFSFSFSFSISKVIG